jgi:peroxiredoxin
MSRSTIGIVTATVFGWALWGGPARAASLEIGQKAPAWSEIVGVDDQKHSLSDYGKAKALVIVFTCNHCPVAKAYEDRLVQLQKDYKDKGVQLIAVNVNTIEADRLDMMKDRAKDKGFEFPYLYDPTQKIGRDYGATCTPHVFLLDKDRKVAYMGAIDDNMNAEKAKVPYLRDAVDAVLEGKEPPKTVTKQVGCGIRWNSNE